GPVELAGEQAASRVLGVERDLVAEAAADVLADEAQFVDADPQRGRHPDRPHSRHLVGPVDRPLPRAAVELDEASRALERSRREAVEVQPFDADDVVRIFESGVEVAPVEYTGPDRIRTS